VIVDTVAVGNVALSPDGSKVVLPLAAGEPEPRTEAQEKDEKAGKDQVVVDRDLRPRRLWILDLQARKAETLTSLGELSAWDFDWSPDGSALVATVTDRNRTDDSYMLKRIAVFSSAGERRELVGVVGKVGEVADTPSRARPPRTLRTFTWEPDPCPPGAEKPR
jgi:hypothetical protein